MKLSRDIEHILNMLKTYEINGLLKERDIQIAYFKIFRDIMGYRTFANSLNFFNSKEGKKNKDIGAEKGIADVSLLTNNTTLYIEFKTLKNYQSKEQKQFEVDCINTNNRYILCKGVGGLESLIKEFYREL